MNDPAPTAIPLEVRVEFYERRSSRLMYALTREDLVFVSVPIPGDTFHPSALATRSTGGCFSTTPAVHHVEHYPTLRDGRALGSPTAHGAGACVVVHERIGSAFEDRELQALRDAGWRVDDLRPHG